MPDENDTERLRKEQLRRARREDELAETADEPDERHTHQRRADKAEYLRKKLDEQSDARDG